MIFNNACIHNNLFQLSAVMGMPRSCIRIMAWPRVQIRIISTALLVPRFVTPGIWFPRQMHPASRAKLMEDGRGHYHLVKV